MPDHQQRRYMDDLFQLDATMPGEYAIIVPTVENIQKS